MKISELLETRISKKYFMGEEPEASRLPSAPSLNDEPQDDDNSDDEANDSTEVDSDKVESIKGVGGDLGRDLYSVTVYNTTEEFADISQITKPTWALEDFGSPVVKSYLSQSDADISNDKTISCVIFNARNGEFFRFDSGLGGSGFEPGIDSLVSSGVIDNDQVNVLRDIESVGRQYSEILDKVIWNAGEVAEGRGAKQLYNVLSRLKDELNLREFRETIHNVKISDEQAAKNAEMSDRLDARAAEKGWVKKPRK